MNQEEIKYKLFDLDKSIQQMKKEKKEEQARQRLPRIYKLTPEKLNKDIIKDNKKLKI